MNYETEMWRFETARFAVVWTTTPSEGIDLSWDETGEVAEQINDGTLECFDSKVAVYLDGEEIAADYLGQSIYYYPAEFRDHIGISRRASWDRSTKETRAAKADFRQRVTYLQGKRQRGEISRRYYENSMANARAEIRKSAERRKVALQMWKSGATCGSYFSDMVRTAIAEARQHIAELDLPRMRA